MGLHRFRPMPSGRMGILWTLAPIRGAALVEFGCMGHMRYGDALLTRAGILDGCKLYSTHIEETDIALGATDKLGHTIANVVKRDRPRVIFLQPSAIPQVIGTDLPALAEELQHKYPDVRLLPFGYGGFDITQHRGVQEALLNLVMALPVDTDKSKEPTFNIIGSCADLYRFRADANEILRMMAGAFGMKPVCILSSDASIADIEKMGGAHINLVIRREGEAAARHLQKRFGTPYLSGRPFGIEGTIRWIEDIAQAGRLTADSFFLEEERKNALKLIASGTGSIRKERSGMVLSLGGHADVVKGILSFGCEELGFKKGTCWCDCPDMGSEDIPYFSEDEWMQAVKSHKRGVLMASAEALDWAGCSREMQISNPGTNWCLYPWEPPFIGFRGAVYLAHLWVNKVAGVDN